MNDPTVTLPGPAVSVDWLAEHLRSPGLVVLDGSWYLPSAGRHGATEFLERRIPGARFFDIDGCADPESDLPHSVPAPEDFRRCAEALGISDSSAVVVYDGSGVNISAPRVWWTFRYFGLDSVAVLDGGIRAWIHAGHPIESGVPAWTLEAPARFTATPRPELIRSAGQILAHLGDPGVQVVDMRSPGRFAGTAPEPRAGLRGGHIPGSRNLHYVDLVDPDTGFAPDLDALRQRVTDAGIDPAATLVGTCGSGTSACAFAWNMARLGKTDVAIYDGSWSEWGRPSELPVEGGPPEP